MFTTKTRVIIGLTTYYNENLIISLSGLSRIGKKAILIIHNDNPDTKITRQQIRAMGYRGDLHIINSEYNIGLLGARMAIIDYVKRHNLNTQWFMFVDDDDILLNLDVPHVNDNHFAIIQNMSVIRTRLVDVLRAINNPDSLLVDNENIYLVRPHLGMSGTLVRNDMILRLCEVLQSAHSIISDITEGLIFRAPIDIMMWSALNIIARHDNPSATPIYMDTVNYIATDIDTASDKYGMPVLSAKEAQSKIASAITKYDNAIRSTLADMSGAAAPMGQETSAE